MKINRNDEVSVTEERDERQYHPRHHNWQGTTTATALLRVLFLITMLLLPSPAVCELNEGNPNQVSEGANGAIVANANGDGSISGNNINVESIFHRMDSNHDVSLSLSEFQTNFKMVQNGVDTITDTEDGIKLPKMKKEFWNGFSTSTMMIIATEIGDKTFFIAAVLSMRNSRYSVFFGSVLALVCMTVLSTLMGLILPSFLPKSYTHIIAGVLFFYFGVKLIYDSRSMEDKVSDELEEVEEELLATRKKEDTGDIESSNGTTTMANSRSATPTTSNSTTVNITHMQPSSTNTTVTNVNHKNNPVSPTSNDNNNTTHKNNNDDNKKRKRTVLKSSIFLQAYILTFLAEWGDRSQIATIALAADKDPYGVTFGACFGHALCTGMAVVGGRILASKISERTVSFWGGFIFLGFGFHSLFMDS